MPQDYASQFGIENIPFGVASSSTRAIQCVTRIGNHVIFLAELAKIGAFKNIDGGQDLARIFLEKTLNSYAALPKSTHQQARTAIQAAYKSGLTSDATEDISSVKLHVPVQVGDFTDFSASADHVQNAGEAIFGVRSFPPAFFNYPVAYAGRSSSIVVSGTPVPRPWGQFPEDMSVPPEKRNVVFAPCRNLDYELEVGAVIGRPVKPGTKLYAKDADEHVFGLVLVNDWSARDIQAFEMNPLGPFNSKNFATTVSPWIITLEALKTFEVPAPQRQRPVAEFLDDPKGVNYAIDLQAEIVRKGVRTTTCTVGFQTMYWTIRHMLAHHTIGGCGLRTGDLIAGGTVSGEADHEHGCLLELTKNGKVASKLSDGSDLRFLEDEDTVVLTGIVGGAESGIGFGECLGVVKPAAV
ncbi:hypothetical protein BS50DRAFT_511240 [Corynespora cassiicola Philippines]|uniref:Fumarylacetoacetase n=1 Tax=Corynespora cassiicola Philippines TaxID=1448308 RepID=A0A2T2P9L5_CORCC|nr:hypothetical protein BS50DRAFT_511240 [Corynespora cassiicola Philippines]